MPNTNAAKKALRQDAKRSVANNQVKNAYKKAIKEAISAIQNNTDDVAAKMSMAQKKLDKAAKKGVIKKNTASRKLARLAKKVIKK